MKKSSKKPVKKMMTGGMENSNIEKRMTSTDVRTRPAGSQGVGTTMSQKPLVPTSAGGTSSGGVNKVPTSAVPSKPASKMLYGGKMKMGGVKKGGSMMKKMGKKK